MSLPVFPTDPSELTYGEAVNQIISSIAMEELALSHILNAEGEKIQYVLGTLPEANRLSPGIDDLLKINESVQQVLTAATQSQALLNSKLSIALGIVKYPSQSPLAANAAQA